MSARAAVDLALRVLALVLLGSMAVTALHDVSQAWDSGYYHLPFAARLVGILSKDVYVFDAENQGRFDGFPLLGELLQGALWRVTGRAAAANLLAFASVPLFAWFLRGRFGVPAHVAVLAMLAIPLVQTHATSTYVDLPANAGVSVVMMLAIEAWAKRRGLTWGTVFAAAIAAAVAGNMKVLVQPIAVMGLVALGIMGLRGAGSRRKVAVLALGALVTLMIPIKNAILWRNPFYPVEMRVLGVVLPGNDTPYSSSPDWLDHAPQAVRFVCSLLEIGVRPFTSTERWTVDQWMAPGADGARMGGFFNVYVIANVGLLVARAVREREGPARRAARAFLALTIITSGMPQSHELRYYLYWMIVLVAINLWLACRAGAEGERGGPVAIGAVAAGVCAAVIWITGATWVRPTGSTFVELVRKKVDHEAVERIAPGARVCARRAPWRMLWAARFNGGKRYVVVEGERAGSCGGAVEIP